MAGWSVLFAVALHVSVTQPEAIPNRAELEKECVGGPWLTEFGTEADRYPRCSEIGRQAALGRELAINRKERSAAVEKHESLLRSIEAAEADVTSKGKNSFLRSFVESPAESHKRSQQELQAKERARRLAANLPAAEAEVRRLDGIIRNIETEMQAEGSQAEITRCKAESERLAQLCARLAKVQEEERAAAEAQERREQEEAAERERREQEAADRALTKERKKYVAQVRRDKAASEAAFKKRFGKKYRFRDYCGADNSPRCALFYRLQLEPGTRRCMRVRQPAADECISELHQRVETLEIVCAEEEKRACPESF